MKKLLLGMALISSFSVSAATIAVIDSGTDTDHADFAGKIWMNPGEIANNSRDEDRNGYQDDVYGWNFAEQNNLVIDRSYLGTFSEDPHKFIEIQGKSFLGQATEEEKAWVNEKRKDPAFIKEMGKFGNFVHGTHVAGITVEGVDAAKILSVKIIPTEVKLPGQKQFENLDAGGREKALHAALDALAKVQMSVLGEAFNYVWEHKADIANGSFGTGRAQLRPITDIIYRVVFFKKPTEAQSIKTANYMMNKLIHFGTEIVKAAPDTLFVFAAGNSGLNNDKVPTSPTNIQADNVLSVAATYKYNFIAPFSNYGSKMVDVAAPGMLIHSQIPGGQYLKVSGTSQAAPYVARIAGQIKDSNKNLSPKEIKAIIMGTVDKKDFLAKKVKTNGIVNLNRAVHAAKLSLNMNVQDAINASNVTINDVEVTNEKVSFNPELITPIQLPSLIK
jgi:subtilisin family serine protease